MTSERLTKHIFPLPINHESIQWLDLTKPSTHEFINKNGATIADPGQTLSTYFEISSSIHDELKVATNELHAMFTAATDHVLKNPEYWPRFEFPQFFWNRAVKSFSKGDKPLSGRLDFSITKEKGIKCYEYNADSASCLMECGYTQGAWSHATNLDKVGRDAGECTAEVISSAWKRILPEGTLVHFLHDNDSEERYHTLYMMELAEKGGMRCKEVIDLNTYKFNENGNIIDDENNVVSHIWKTWSYVTLLDKLERDGGSIRRSGDVRLVDICLHDDITVFEPIWCAIPSNKAILPILSELFPDSPYLLRSTYSLTDWMHLSGYVTKPVSGRCGENIAIHSAESSADTFHEAIAATLGRFQGASVVYQELCSLPKLDGNFVQINTFCGGGQYAGTVTRVDASPIIGLESSAYVLRVVDTETPPYTSA
jgi:glutathionylspermidine amidase/synthetase